MRRLPATSAALALAASLLLVTGGSSSATGPAAPTSRSTDARLEDHKAPPAQRVSPPGNNDMPVKTYQKVWPDEPTTRMPGASTQWRFIDRFNGGELNQRVWTAETGRITELCVSDRNVGVRGGHLLLTVRRGQTQACPYVGARVVTEGKRRFAVGLIEARIKVNSVPGYWGGFTMFGPKVHPGNRLADGEIDTEFTHNQIHYRLWSVNELGDRCGVPIDVPFNGLDRWHVYGIDRQHDYTRFLFDGRVAAVITKRQLLAMGCTWPFDDGPFTLVLSARAGRFGGTPVASEYPTTTLVGWVRAPR